MKKQLLILFAAFLLWLPVSISQQITITGEDVCAHTDSTATVGITIDNFSQVLSAQFAIIYDPAVLTFISVGDPPNFGPGNSSAFIFLFAPGEIRFSWFDSSVPFGDPAATIFFTLEFDVIGSGGTMSAISFPTTSSNGFQMQFVKTSGVVPNGNVVRNPGNVEVDNTPPVILNCPANISDTLYNGQTSKMVNWAAPDTSDNCEMASFVSTHSPGDIFSLGTTQVTYTATDEAGNMATCQFSVELVQAPISDSLTFTAVGGTITCDDTLKVPITVLNFDSIYSFSLGLSWDTSILTFVDFQHNLMGSGSVFSNPGVDKFKITFVTNNFPGGLSLADFDTLFCLRFVLANPFTAMVSDTIDFVNFPSDNPPFAIEVSNPNGIIPNSSIDFNSAIVTALPATITCPAAVNTNTNTGCTATGVNLGTVVFSDNCPPGGFMITNDAPAAFPKGITTVNWMVADVGGNTATCTQTVTVSDNVPPSITCPANILVNTSPGTCSAVVNYTAPVGTDNCPMPVTAQTAGLTSGVSYPKGITTNTFMVTDMAGNTASCSFTVTVNDTELPVITCPANVSVNTDMSVCSAVVNYTAPVGTDNCPMPTTAQTAGLASGAPFPKGITTNTFTVTDMAGNTASCSFTVTVNDNELPTVTCPADTVLSTDAGQCTAVVNYPAPAGADNCPMFTIAQTEGLTIGEAFPKGITTNTFRVMDMAGNTATCSFTVTVNDSEPPAITCPEDISAGTDDGLCTAVVTYATPVGTDNCPMASSVQTEGLASGAAYPIGTTTNTFTVTDMSGSTASCSFVVTVADDEPPVIVCPSDIAVANEPDSCGAFVSWTATSATDNCVTVTIAQTGGPASGSLFPVGVTTVTYLATDAANNTATCSFEVTVTDTQPAPITCPADITKDADEGDCEAVVNWMEPIVKDNCPDVSVIADITPGSVFPVGMTTVTYTATDAASNTATCSFTVTVEDNEAPELTCPEDVTVQASSGNTSAVVNDIPLLSVEDNCGATVFSFEFNGATTGTFPGDDASGMSFNIGETTVTYTAEDDAGNSGSCSFNVTVDASVMLTLTCPSDTFSLNDLNECDAVINDLTLAVSPPEEVQTIFYEMTGATTGTANGDISGAAFNVGQTLVTYTAVNFAQDSFTCDFTVFVIDNQPPVFNCPNDIVVSMNGSVLSDPSGFLTNFVRVDCDSMKLFFPAIIASDNCGVAGSEQTEGLISGNTFPVGENTFVYAAIDVNGNQGTCAFDITVLPLDEINAVSSPANLCEGEQVSFSVNQYSGATYMWLNPQGQTVSTAPSFTLQGVTTAQSGNYTAKVTLPFNCVLEDVVSIVVSKNPEIQASANDLLCMGGNANLNLTATSTNNVAVANWVWQFPNGSLVSQQNPVVPNATPANSGTYMVTGTTANGCSGTASKVVVISNEPMTPTLFGTDNEVCQGEQIVFNSQVFSGNNVSYHWFAVPATGSGLTSINNPIVSAHPSAAGTFTYHFYAEVDGCKSDTAEWIVQVQAPPALSLSVDGNVICVPGNTPITLLASGVGNSTCQWTGLNTGFSSNQPSPTLQNVTAANSDIYRLTCTTSFGCQSTASVNVQITNQPPTPQLVASDSTVCTGETITLMAFPPYGPGASYLWSGPNLPPFSGFVQSVNVTPAQPGSYNYTFRAQVNGCTTSVATVPVVVENTPPVQISVKGETKCVPGNTTVTLKSNATGATSLVWTDASGATLSTLDSLNITNANSGKSGTYFVKASNGIGCEMTGSVNLQITDALAPVTASLAQPACEKGELRFNATLIPGATYQWKNPNNVFAIVQNPVIPNASTALNGSYVVTALKDGCSSTSSPLIVKVRTSPLANDNMDTVQVDTPKDINVVLNDVLDQGAAFNVQILQQPMHGKLADPGGGVFTYTPNDGFRETDRFLYEICYDDCPDACDIALATMVVRYPANLCLITNVITPNNDGINDELVVSCLEVASYPNNSLIIFNQWGDKVFDASPYKNDWKGTYKGKDLPDGTYYYIFKRDANTPGEKGFVMIYR